MRLIDARNVLKALDELHFHSLSGKMDISNAIYLVESQKTVCDLDMVIEQLEDIRSALKKAEKTMEIAYVYNADENLGILIQKLKAGVN